MAIISLPRRTVSTAPGLRLALDSLAVGTALTFLLMRAVLAWPQSGLTFNNAGTSAFVLADCTVLAAVFLTGVRDSRSGVWPTVLGVFCHVVADFMVMVSAESGGPRSIPGCRCRCGAWPGR